jgi:hypothetical protein
MPLDDMGRSDDEQSSGDGDLYRRLRREFRDDVEHWRGWREAAREDYRLYAGDQWADEDKQALEDARRPVVSFNRVQPTINVVSGHEISNRQELRFIPREMGDVRVSEIVTSAAKWFREEADAEDEESDAFRDSLICGMGWIENRLDHDRDPDGKPTCDRLDPLEFIVDRYARKPNLLDATRLFRVRTMSRADALALLPEAEEDDIDAAWAKAVLGGSGLDDAHENTDPAYQQEADVGSLSKEVTVVEVQFSKREAFVRTLDPFTGEEVTLSVEEHKRAASRLPPEIAGTLPVVKQKRLVRYRAFMGRTGFLGKPEPTACPTHFSYQCITGLRDQIKGTWFGLVRPMADPQKWANKFFSQTLHILNSTAKGGVMIEDGAVEDMREFEGSWARTEAVTRVPHGTLSNANGPRIVPKPVGQFPAGVWQMMQFSIDAIRDATGVNQEMLGLRDATQPGVLEMQRKQAGMTIISAFFDSLRRYRKNAGEIILYILQHDIPDGRMIRVVGKDQEQHIPLMKDKLLGDYDIIVDEAPTAPNVKDRTWGLLQPLLPMLPPQAQLALLDYAPLPESAVQRIKEAAEQSMAQQPPPDPKVEQARAMMELKQQEFQMQQAMKQQEMQQTLQIEREKAAAEYELAKMRLSNEMMIEQMRLASQQEIETFKARTQAQNDARRVEIEAARPQEPMQ